MQFSAASNSQMTVNPSSDLYNSTTGTISFWMNSTGTTGTGSDGAVLFDMRSTRGLMILQTDAGNIRVRAYRQSDGAVVNEIVSNALVSDGQWHLITVNFSQALNSTCSLYIDGVLDKSGTNTSAWNWTTTETLKLGRSTGTNALPYKSYNGLMDDFRFYTAQLTPAQISDMANGLDGGVTTSDVGLNVQGDMQNVNTSAFIRVPFDVTVPSSISTLTLTMRFTDGFVAWINGQQVAAVNAPSTLAWNSWPRRRVLPERYYTVTFAATSGLLQAGTNILAIQGMDVSASEANFLILPQLNSDTIASGSGVYFATPTPGAANSAGKTNLGPYVSNVTDDVSQPTGGSSSPPLTIQATIGASLHALSTVQIAYRIMFGSETLATMYDDGTHGDPSAGDGIYTAQIPTTALTAGQMLRWRVIATDTTGAQTTGPAFNNPTDSDQYYGTVAVSGISTDLPMVQVFVPNYVIPTSTSNETTVDTDAGARGDLYYNGELYDNVLIRIKGSTTRYLLKRSHHVDFNSDHKFLWEVGQPRVSNAEFNAEYVDPSYAAAIPCLCGFFNHRRALKALASPDFPVRMQMNGSFWQLAFFTMPEDSGLLDVLGLDSDEGSWYKDVGTANPGSPEKRTREWEGNSDYNALANAALHEQPARRRRADASIFTRHARRPLK